MSDAKKAVYMIGNSHIDAVWLWRDREGLQEARATFASALDRMDEFDEFVFTASSARLFEWVEQHHPDLFARIRQRVQEGRWQLAGGWWIEPDVNIPSGESLIRQGLYGQRYFERAFGKMARTGFNVDSFGHSQGVVRILAQQGIESYVFMRPNKTQWTLPAPLFRWEDTEGTALIGCQTQGEYCAWTKTAIVDNLSQSLSAMEAHGFPAYPVFYGVGNHGGGPTIENIKAIRELSQEHAGLAFYSAGPDAFFETVDPATLPAYAGELEGIFPGCYTSDSGLKRLCRQCESALTHAESISIMAKPYGFPYPADALDEAWKLLLFAQFHDTMAGTARKEARDDACLDMARCLSIARDITGGAMQALSAAIDTRGDGHALLLLNTTDSAFHGLVDADIYWREKHPLRLKNAAGYEIPYDNTRYRRVAPDARKRLVFYADIPAFGFAVYRMLPETPQIAMPAPMAQTHRLENDHLRLTFDPATGALTSLFDKRHQRECLRAPVTLDVYEDLRDAWGAVGAIDKRLGQYSLDRMFVLENGGVRSTLCVILRYGRSEATLRYSLGREDAHVTLEGVLDNREKQTITMLRTPFAQTFDAIEAEMPYAEIRRPYDLPGERHCQRYTNLTGSEGSMLLVNQAKYAYRVFEGAYETVLSRTPIHAFSTGEEVEDGRLYAYSDMGELPFTLQLHPHMGDISRADRIRIAQRLHRPPEVLADTLHDAALTPRAQSFAHLEGMDGCVLHLLKLSAEGDPIARVENTTGEAQEGTLHVHGQHYPLHLAPNQLATVRICSDGTARITNALEKS